MCKNCIDKNGEKYFLSKCCNKVLTIDERITEKETSEYCTNCGFECETCGYFLYNCDLNVCLNDEKICTDCLVYNLDEDIICKDCAEEEKIYCCICVKYGKYNGYDDLRIFKCDLCNRIVCENCSIIDDWWSSDENRLCRTCI